MSRWDPFREMLSLREAMNQLLEESVVRPASAGAAGGAGGGGAAGRGQPLALDVAEREDAYVVSASLPGVRPEDVHVTVLGDTLAIRAETRREDERSAGGYLLRERHVGTLQRTVTLPGPISADDVSADYEHGILMLTLPKSRANMPRRIQVRSGAAGGAGGQARIDTGTGSPGGQQAPIEAAVRPTESGVSTPAEATTGVDAEAQQESTPTTTTRARGGRRTSRAAAGGGAGTGQSSESAGEGGGASGSSRSRGGQRTRRRSSDTAQEG